LIVNGTVEDVMTQARTERILHIQVAGRPQHEAADLLISREEVETVDLRGGVLIVKLKRPDIRHSALAQNLIEEGFELMLFKEEEINLETAFMHLTKGITS
jgi:ABC-2 type transport system ATP-binding protein